MAVSQRLMVLSQSKQLHSRYVPPRATPQWPVSTAALNAICSPRVVDLAVSKKQHPQFLEPKPVKTEVSLSARNAKPSPRIRVLAAPLVPRHAECKLVEFQKSKLYEDKRISVSNCTTYTKQEMLAIRKSLHSRTSHQIQQPVTKPHLNIKIPPRLVELSTPLSRKMIKDIYNPFQVIPTAKYAVASERLSELAKPKTHHLYSSLC
ncbi:testicular haploid expressed gene protein-like isoform X1 [Octopus sinensis]|uniref:Testicular haploid expressed gene protein-like isoform X1 n=1 Tax=Octopus sinensis TaxID=2607531 RepID=A0A7E6FMN1_9MOLL|nr:testicular haploid expressed gene protein-like isoform X1 [Octopus sinensis]